MTEFKTLNTQNKKQIIFFLIINCFVFYANSTIEFLELKNLKMTDALKIRLGFAVFTII
jgi:hypothetical protein